MSATVDARFWLMRTNVDKKIASSDTISVSRPNGKGSKRRRPMKPLVLSDPPREPHDLHVDEPHVAGEPSQPVSQAVLQRRSLLLGLPNFDHRVNVSLNDVGKSWIIRMATDWWR